MENKRCKLTIIRGIPGSGKSTFAKSNYKCLILENDMFHIKSGKYDWKSETMPDAVKWCFSTCEKALELGMDVVVSNTFTKRKFIEGYYKLAEKYNADFEVIRCTGNYQNIHDVPSYVMKSMKHGFEDWDNEIYV